MQYVGLRPPELASDKMLLPSDYPLARYESPGMKLILLKYVTSNQLLTVKMHSSMLRRYFSEQILENTDFLSLSTE
jgi:hypothetical protein